MDTKKASKPIFPLKNIKIASYCNKMNLVPKRKSVYDSVFSRLAEQARTVKGKDSIHYAKMFNLVYEKKQEQLNKKRDCSECMTVTKLHEMHNNPSVNYTVFWNKERKIKQRRASYISIKQSSSIKPKQRLNRTKSQVKLQSIPKRIEPSRLKSASKKVRVLLSTPKNKLKPVTNLISRELKGDNSEFTC